MKVVPNGIAVETNIASDAARQENKKIAQQSQQQQLFF
jgi:hypothetical protein